MISLRPHRLPFGLLLTLAALAGCGPPNDKVLVSGTVTWDGKPIPTGQIELFLPQRIPAGAGPIANGRFKFLSKTGNVTVEIHANRARAITGKAESTRSHEQYVPARYNRQTELTAELVPPGPVSLKFDLRSE